MQGELKLQSVIGNVEIDGRRFKYCAEFDIRVDVQTNNSKRLDFRPHNQSGFFDSVRSGVMEAGKGFYNTITNKDFQKDVANGFERAGKVAVLAHAAVVFKAGVINTLSTTPISILPIAFNDAVLAICDGYPPVPPSTAPGVLIAIGNLAFEWSLSPPPWEK